LWSIEAVEPVGSFESDVRPNNRTVEPPNAFPRSPHDRHHEPQQGPEPPRGAEDERGDQRLGRGVAVPLDLDSFLEHAEDPILGGVEIKQAILTVPDTPGIGARPDPAWRGKLEEVR
jgi:hypothetical protein